MPGSQSGTGSCFPTLEPDSGKEAMGFIPVPVCQWELFPLWGRPSWQPLCGWCPGLWLG